MSPETGLSLPQMRQFPALAIQSTHHSGIDDRGARGLGRRLHPARRTVPNTRLRARQRLDDSTGKGAAFLAPLGNLEVATGYPPSQPTLMIEVTQLDEIHAAVKSWLLTHQRSEAPPPNSPTHSHPLELPLFTAQITNDLTVGFWQSENPLHNRPIAIEGDLSAANKRFAIVVARWNASSRTASCKAPSTPCTRSGCPLKDIQIVRVPGAWEIPRPPAPSRKPKITQQLSRWASSSAARRPTTRPSTTR